DNSSFENQLLQRGFSIQKKSKSNYNGTLLSMTSLFNMNYIDEIKNPRALRSKDLATSMKFLKHNAVHEIFKQHHYKTHYCTIFEIGEYANVGRDLMPPPMDMDILVVNTFWGAIKNQFFSIFEKHIYLKKHQSYFEKTVRHIPQFLSRETPQNEVFYSHFLVTHMPFLFDSKGSYFPWDEMESIRHVEEAERVKYYLNGVKKANQVMIQTVDSILKHDADRAIILLISDHGYGNPFPEDMNHYFFKNLNAVYFPDKNYAPLYDSMSNVNLMRAVINKMFGYNLKRLEDKTIFLSPDKREIE